MNKREKKPKFVRFTLRMPDEQWRQIKEMAARMGISASGLVRRSLDRTLHDELAETD